MSCNCDINPIINQLAEYGVQFWQDGGKTMVKMPWSPSNIPEDVKPLLLKIKQANQVPTIPKMTKIEPLPSDTATLTGQVVTLHRMRPTCQAAGHCLGLTQEIDCNLFPVRLGWCRERVNGGVKQ